MEQSPHGADLLACYQRRRDVSVEEVAGETLVLDDRAGCLHQLNQTASFVWNRCDGATSVASIARSLSDQFDVEDDVAKKDVADVVTRLCELNLLVGCIRGGL
jgi:hypothetical protein